MKIAIKKRFGVEFHKIGWVLIKKIKKCNKIYPYKQLLLLKFIYLVLQKSTDFNMKKYYYLKTFVLALFFLTIYNKSSAAYTYISSSMYADTIASTCDTIKVSTNLNAYSVTPGTHKFIYKIYWGDGTFSTDTTIATITGTYYGWFRHLTHGYLTPGVYNPIVICAIDSSYVGADTSNVNYFLTNPRARTTCEILNCTPATVDIDTARVEYISSPCGAADVTIYLHASFTNATKDFNPKHIKIYWGDGTSFSVTIGTYGTYLSSFTHIAWEHTYTNPGNYNVSYVVQCRTTVDSVYHPNEVMLDTCSKISGYLYSDCDSNCIKGSTESVIPSIKLYNYRSSVLVDSTVTSSTGFYTFNVPRSSINTVVVKGLSSHGFTATCPASDSTTVTASSISSITTSKNLAINCITPEVNITTSIDTTTTVNCDSSTIVFRVSGNTRYISSATSLTVRVRFGDGTFSTNFISLPSTFDSTTFNTFFTHKYTSPGIYNVSYEAFSSYPSLVKDSVYHPAEVTIAACNMIYGQVYSDCNNNCIKDASESYISGVNVRIFQGTTLVYNGFTNTLGKYNYTMTPGLAYNIVLSNLTILGYTASCPATGSSLITAIAGSNVQNFAINCTSPNISIDSAYDSLSTYPCGYKTANFNINSSFNNIATSSVPTLKIYFGDGTSTTITGVLTGTFASSTCSFNIAHTYTSFNSYAVRYVVSVGTVKDSVYHAAEVNLVSCANLSGYIYYDCNNNCVRDTNEFNPYDNLSVYILNDTIAIDTITVNLTTGFYSIDLDTGINYTVVFDSSNAIRYYEEACGTTFSTNILLHSGANQNNIGVRCFQNILIFDDRHLVDSSVLCAPRTDTFFVSAVYTNYYPGDSVHIIAYFGDGLSEEHIVICPSPVVAREKYLYERFIHTYPYAGVYSFAYEIFVNDTIGDTLFLANEVHLEDSCGSITGLLYLDRDSNCVYSVGDIILPNQQVVLRQGGTIIAYDYTDMLGNYYFIAPVGPTYTVSVPSVTTTGMLINCPISGSITFASTGFDINDFAYKTSGVSFDLQAHNFNLTRLRPGQISTVTVRGRQLRPGIPSVPCVLTLTIDPRLTYAGPGHMFSAGMPPTTVSGSTFTWNLSLSSAIGALREIQVRVDSDAVITDTYCFAVSIEPTIGDMFLANNSETNCINVFSSYDPNYKTVSPAGIGELGYVLPNQWLEYTVHFQNMGNDTAFNVFVIDTIDPNLDIESFEFISSSHTCHLYSLANRAIKFDFPHINLPDSTTDVANSVGEFTYRVKMKNDLSNATQINNTAYIYFDINPPIITNTTLNTINKTLGIAGEEQLEVSVFPNPASSFVQIQLSDISNAKAVLVYDIIGNRIKEYSINNTVEIIPINDLTNGMYVVKIIDKNENVINEKNKIVVSH